MPDGPAFPRAAIAHPGAGGFPPFPGAPGGGLDRVRRCPTGAPKYCDRSILKRLVAYRSDRDPRGFCVAGK